MRLVCYMNWVARHVPLPMVSDEEGEGRACATNYRAATMVFKQRGIYREVVIHYGSNTNKRHLSS